MKRLCPCWTCGKLATCPGCNPTSLHPQQQLCEAPHSWCGWVSIWDTEMARIQRRWRLLLFLQSTLKNSPQHVRPSSRSRCQKWRVSILQPSFPQVATNIRASLGGAESIHVLHFSIFFHDLMLSVSMMLPLNFFPYNAFNKVSACIININPTLPMSHFSRNIYAQFQ